MISQAESLLHIGAASLISTALLAFGLRGEPREKGSTRRRKRWASLLGGAFGVVISGFTGLVDGLRINDATTLAFTLGGLAVMAILALLLLRVGLRGRRVGDHPYCHACGFDLFGKPAESNVCNECGTDLTKANAIVIGTRQRRMVPLSCGLFLLILALAISLPTAPDLYRQGRAMNWTPYKPTRWLIQEYSANPRKNDSAGVELWRRLEADSLDAESIRAFIAAVGAQSSMRGVPPYLGTLWLQSSIAREGFKHAKVDEQTMRAMLQASLDLHLEMAAQASRGNTLRYWICSPDIATAREPNVELTQLSFTNRRVTINGIAVPETAVDLSPYPASPGQWIMLKALGDRIHLDALPTPLAAGPATVEMRMTASATLALPGRPMLVETKDLVIIGKTTIVEPDAMRCPPIFDLADPSLAADDPVNTAADAKKTLSTPNPLPAASATMVAGGKWTLTVTRVTSGAIMGEAILRTGDTERPLGPIFLTAYQSVDFPLDAQPASGSTLILRPTPERGAELFQSTPTYQLPIEIPVE